MVIKLKDNWLLRKLGYRPGHATNTCMLLWDVISAIGNGVAVLLSRSVVVAILLFVVTSPLTVLYSYFITEMSLNDLLTEKGYLGGATVITAVFIGTAILFCVLWMIFQLYKFLQKHLRIPLCFDVQILPKDKE